jgi:hypothetical protein
MPNSYERQANGTHNLLTKIVSGTITTVSALTQGYISSKMLMATDSTTNLAAGAAYTSPVKDGGSTPLYKMLRVRVFATQPVTLDIYHGVSSTVTSNRIQHTQSIPANTVTLVEIPLVARYSGIKVTNTGAATTTTLEVLSALIGN